MQTQKSAKERESRISPLLHTCEYMKCFNSKIVLKRLRSFWGAEQLKQSKL